MYITHTPVSDGVVRAWHGLMVKPGAEHPSEEDIQQSRAFQEASKLAFLQDFEVWSAKKPAIEVLQLTADGPYHKARQWYGQFYRPRGDAKAIQASVDGSYTVKWMPAAPQAVSEAGKY
jgi:3-ketosteroid 9alpha-monooxygenase subunit A